jgi:hypothetical protein
MADPELQTRLDWMRSFVREETMPLWTLALGLDELEVVVSFRESYVVWVPGPRTSRRSPVVQE